MAEKNSDLKIATWNVCLGLSNKKYCVLEALIRNNVAICGLQEIKVENNFPNDLLNCGGYTLEIEQNTGKRRSGIYVRNDVQYTRRSDLEIEDCHVVIIDAIIGKVVRIINL